MIENTVRIKRLVKYSLAILGCGVFAFAVWAAFTPVQSDSREEHFKIPQGTWARRMAGNKVEILPNKIELTLGVRDVLVLENHDDVPQIFGPTLMMPGQSFRLPFSQAADYTFTCTAHASGQMIIVVDEFPASPWARFTWRLRHWLHRALNRL